MFYSSTSFISIEAMCSNSQSCFNFKRKSEKQILALTSNFDTADIAKGHFSFSNMKLKNKN